MSMCATIRAAGPAAEPMAGAVRRKAECSKHAEALLHSQPERLGQPSAAHGCSNQRVVAARRGVGAVRAMGKRRRPGGLKGAAVAVSYRNLILQCMGTKKSMTRERLQTEVRPKATFQTLGWME